MGNSVVIWGIEGFITMDKYNKIFLNDNKKKIRSLKHTNKQANKLKLNLLVGG